MHGCLLILADLEAMILGTALELSQLIKERAPRERKSGRITSLDEEMHRKEPDSI